MVCKIAALSHWNETLLAHNSKRGNLATTSELI